MLLKHQSRRWISLCQPISHARRHHMVTIMGVSKLLNGFRCQNGKIIKKKLSGGFWLSINKSHQYVFFCFPSSIDITINSDSFSISGNVSCPCLWVSIFSIIDRIRDIHHKGIVLSDCGGYFPSLKYILEHLFGTSQDRIRFSPVPSPLFHHPVTTKTDH